MSSVFFLGGKRFEIRDVKPGPLAGKDVLVKVAACGVCGTDVHIYHGEEGTATVTPPVVLGHEFSGVVEAVGDGVASLRTGDHVSVDPNRYCGRCCFCRTGKKQMCENLQAIGVTKVIVADVIEKRLAAAKSMGAITINAKEADVPAEIARLTGNNGAQVVIDCAGTNTTLGQTVLAAKSGGAIVWVGLAADTVNGLKLSPISTKELTIKSIFRYRNLYPAAIEAIAGGKIDISGIISNKYKFEETPRAFEETLKNAQNIVKSVIMLD